MLNYIQDNKNVQDNTINEMLKDVTSSYKAKNQKKGTFSGILNNLSSKTEKVQTNFVDKVAKTNTSSINRALFKDTSDKKSKTESINSTEQPSTNDNKDFKKLVKAYKKQNKTDLKEDLKETKDNNNNLQEAVAELDNKVLNVVQNDENVSKEIKAETKENSFQADIEQISNVEYNSFVESSPVFFKEENPETSSSELVSVKDDDVIATVGALLTLNTKDSQIFNKDESLEKLSSELLQSDNIEGKIEEITETLDGFNLSKDNQEEIKEAFDKIKEIKTNSDNTGNKFEAKAEVKEILSKLSDDIKVNNENADLKSDILDSSVFNSKEVTLASSNYVEDFKKPEILNFEENEEAVEVSLKPIEKEDSEENTVKIASNDVKNDIKPDENDILNSRQVVFDDEKVFEVQKSVQYDDEVNFDDEINFDDEVLDLEPNLQLKEKISLNQGTNKDFVQEADNINKISEMEENTTVKTAQMPEITTDNFKNQTANNPKENNQQPFDNKLATNDLKAQKIEPKAKEFKVDNESESDLDGLEITEDNVETNKLYARVEDSSNVEESANVEENLEKLTFEQEKLDNILVSMSKETANNATLTVADEVAKISMNEDVAINSSVNIVYDSAGDNILLKNMQSIRPSENIFTQLQSKLENSDILNQISEKFEQMKGAINQKFTMVLRPNDLGRLSIELTNGLKGLITNIVVQNESVRNFIEKNLNSLRNQLASSGVNVQQIQIKMAGSGDTTTYSGNHENQSSQQDDTFKQNEQNNQNQNEQNQNKKQYFKNDDVLASLNTFDTSFANDFSSILNKTINYGIN